MRSVSAAASSPGRFARAAAIVALAMVGGCTLGPDFLRPDLPTAKRYAGEERTLADASPAGEAEKLQHVVTGGKLPAEWWDLFRSAQLKDLLALAVDGN